MKNLALSLVLLVGCSVVSSSEIEQALTPPPAPTNVTAVAISDTQIDVSWSPVSNAVKYYVYVLPAGETVYAYYDSVLAPGTLSQARNLAPNKLHSFKVEAEDSAGLVSLKSNPAATATTYPAGQNNVVPPSGVAASPVSDSRIEVTWNPVPGAFKYYVYRAEGAGPFTYVDTVLAPGTTHLSINLLASTQYSFTVRTSMADGRESVGTSMPVSATTYAIGLNNVPVPSNVVASPVSDSRIEVTWDPIPNAFKYYVYRAQGAGPSVYVDTVLAPGTTHLSINLAASTQYTFTVQTAMIDGSESVGTSAPVSATTYAPGFNNVPTPSNVVPTALSDTRMQVTWDPIPGAFKYYVYRAQGAGPLVYVDTVLAPGTTHISINLTANTPYSYTIGTAMQDGSESVGQSAPVTATTLPPGETNVALPTNVIATALSDTRIDLTWDSVPGAFKYYVYRSLGAGPLVYVDSVLEPSTTHSSFNLTASTEYQYSLRTVLTDGTESSSMSAPVSATTLTAGQTNVPAPTNIVATAISPTRVTLMWDAVPGAAKYYVSRAEGAGGYMLVDSVVAPSTQHLSVNLLPDTLYSYRLITVMPDALESAPSSAVSVTTPNSVPQNVNALAISDSQVRVTWEAVAHARKYFLLMGQGSSPLATIGEVFSPNTTFHATNLTADTSYTFAVIAVIDDGSVSAQSSTSSATTMLAGRGAPTSVIAEALSSTAMRVTWATVPQAFKYYVYRAVENGPFVFQTTILAPNTIYETFLVQPSTTYRWQIVTAHTDGSETPPSMDAIATTNPCPFTIGAQALTQGGGSIVSVITGDFNGDGKQDIVAGSSGSGHGIISFFAGNGAGGFATPLWRNTVLDLSAIAAADIDHDGDLDIVTGRYCGVGPSTCDFEVLLGNGNGTFAAPTTLTNPTPNGGPIALLQDLDGDTHVDAVFMNRVDITVMKGDGAGGFSSAATYAIRPSFFAYSVRGVVVGDFNRDGKPDLAASDQGSATLPSTIGVFFNDGAGGFGAPTLYDMGAGSGDLVVADVDENGYLDLISSSATDLTISVRLGSSSGFAARSATAVTGVMQLSDLDVGDFNHDGHFDLALAVRISTSVWHVRVSSGTGRGTFTPFVATTTGSNTANEAVADFDGDGFSDLARAPNSGAVAALRKGTCP